MVKEMRPGLDRCVEMGDTCSMSASFRLPGIPAELSWRLQPVEWALENGGGLSIRAAAKTDLFTDPKDGAKSDAAPAALFTPPDRAFTLSARVNVDFSSTYDAGVFHVRAAEDRWGKLCFEYSPQGEPMVVSVVTHGLSDDCNSIVVPGESVYLRVAQSETAAAFHYSFDGSRWSFVRYFSLGSRDGLRVGFSSQSPTGEGCRAAFSEITYRPGFPRDLRNGE
jgi:regulation of enolase protein 1 (concanavalin A-like superfamily)